MSMKTMDEIREILCDNLEDVRSDMKQKGVTDGNLERAHKLTDAIKNMDKICIMSETGDYAQAGDWEARGRFGDQYAREGYSENGNSYRRDSMGRYSREGGYEDGMSQRRGRRGYSRGGMMEHVDAMMEEAENEEQREAIRRFKKQLKEM